jgi:Protein of unknown function (DUF1329)
MKPSIRSYVVAIAGIIVVMLLALRSELNSAEASHSNAGAPPPGTKITYANWEQYKEFMPPAMQALFAGKYFWKMPADVEMEVGPTLPIPLPPAYLADTEKNAGRVTLQKLPGAGYIPAGYTTGLPFPNPLSQSALAPYAIFYNLYYHYNPRVQQSVFCDYSGDSYGNFTSTSQIETVYSQLAHLSEPNMPATVPTSGGYYFAKFIQQIAPEQGKYTTSLDLTYQDITKLDDIYTYLPTSRRPIRSSDAARCAPLQNTDFTWEDAALGPPGLPQQFEIKYLGEQRILALVHAEPVALKQCGTATQLPSDYYYPAAKGILPWAKPSLGKWELRDTYVIDMSRLPAYSQGYCYSRRVIYVDKETFFPLAIELYDRQGVLSRFITQFWTPQAIPGGGSALGTNGPQAGWSINFTDRHVTIAVTQSSCYDTNCDSQFLDASQYASPEGLMKIIQ